MNRIGARLARCKKEGRAALVTYLTFGDPNPAASPALIAALSKGGADVLELGVPFSDPSADGTVLEAAMVRSLQAGTRFEDVLGIVLALRAGKIEGANPELPVILFGYANPFLKQAELPERLHAAGVDGLLCVDMPPEEGSDFYAALIDHDVDPILLSAPTSSDARVQQLSKAGRGFLYYVALKGVTGSAWGDADSLEAGVARVCAQATLPVCAGFGVDGPEAVARLASVADGVVVGSAIVRRIAEAGESGADAPQVVEAFVASLSAATRSAPSSKTSR